MEEDIGIEQDLQRVSSSSQAQTDDRQPVAVAYWDQALHELIRLVAGSGE